VKRKSKGARKMQISGVGKIGAAKKRKNRKVVVGLFFGVGLLGLVLIWLVLSSFGFFEKAGELEYFSVKDECGDVMGNLIHQIRDDGECRMKCVNECDVREMEFVSFEFELRSGDCNACACWCK